MQNLGTQINKRSGRLAVISLIAFLGFIYAGSNQNIARAEVYYGEPRECTTYDPVKCPPNYVEKGDFCRPYISEFCKVFTGSDAVSEVDNRPVCARPPILGACNAQDNNYNPPSIVNSAYMDNVRNILKSVTPIPTNSNNNAIFDYSDSSIKYLLFDGGSNNWRVNNTDHIKNDTYRAVACLEQNGTKLITIPVAVRMSRGLWYSQFDRSLAPAGLALQLPATAGYCKNPGDLIVEQYGGGNNRDLTIKCVAGVPTSASQPGCVLKDKDNDSNSICLKELKYVGEPILGPGISRIRDQVFDLNSPGRVQIISNNASDPKCYKTAKEQFQIRANKGCSDFTYIDSATNTVKKTANYDSCIKCIYGDPALLPENIMGSVAKISSMPAAGGAITPDTEPLAIPIPGQLYTDLGGCINASSTGSVVNTIVRVALGVMGGIVILRIIQGALTMQKGDPEGFQEGREVITSALIGLLLLIFSAALLNFLGINILGLDVATFGS